MGAKSGGRGMQRRGSVELGYLALVACFWVMVVLTVSYPQAASEAVREFSAWFQSDDGVASTAD